LSTQQVKKLSNRNQFLIMSEVKNLKKENLFHLFISLSVNPQIHTLLQIETIAKKMDLNQKILKMLSTIPFEKVDYNAPMEECLYAIGDLFFQLREIETVSLSKMMQLKIEMENNIFFIVVIGQMEKSIEILEKR
jgi:hypothetical protein